MVRKPLGRGLGALIERESDFPDHASEHQLIEVALDEVVPSAVQPRRHFDRDKLEELAEAIRSQGIIEPLVVRKAAVSELGGPRYELIAGERRWRAARAAGLDRVPVVVRELDNRAALEMSLVENLVREDLNSIDEARALARLASEFALSHEEVAGRIGKSRPFVSNAIRLLDLPEPVLQMVERGELTVGQIRPLLGLDSAAAQLAAARRIAEQKISARGAEQLAGAKRAPSARRGGGPGADPHLQALSEAMQRGLKRKVRIVVARGKSPGRIEIEFYNDEDLTALSVKLGVG